MIELRPDEEKLIMLIRSCRKFATITIEKRPTVQYPDGELNRVVSIGDSFMLKDMVIGKDI